MPISNKEWDIIVSKFNEKGSMLTKQRRTAIDEILSLDGHHSADEIVDVLKKKKIQMSRATVYRLLSILAEVNLLEAHDFDMNKKLYERKVGKFHHDHLYCIGCRTIIEFSSESIEREQDKILKKFGFIEIYHSHKIFGLCPDCKKKKFI
ncbi:MAG: transcriptional repressor [Planctomycetes bacterium]|nr:transcriptional repressor [Planctomycetota bacterium]